MSRFGTNTIVGARLGTENVAKLYYGTALVWQKQAAEEPHPKALCFSAPSDQTIALTKNGTITINLEYSYDGVNFQSWDLSKLSFGGSRKVYIRGNNTRMSSSTTVYTRFTFETSAKVTCEGNLMHLLSYTQDLTTINQNYCFLRLFYNCTALEKAPDMPATTLTNYCYYYMYYGCSSLKAAPDIPATNAPTYSCYYMFRGCSSILEPPILSPTTIGTYAYYGMFYQCTSLVEAPELPATTISNYSYYYMFYGCTSLQYGAKMMSTTYASNNSSRNYYGMYYNCTQLKWAMLLTTTTPSSSSNYPTYRWMYNVPTTTGRVFVQHINATWTTTGTHARPSTNWTRILYNPSNDTYYLTDKKTVCDKFGNKI